MMTLMLAQVLIGLFVSDVDGLESGPLSHLVSFDPAARSLKFMRSCSTSS